MSVADLLAKFDLTQYGWEPLPGDPKGRTRLLCGGEYIEEIYHTLVQGEQILFFGTYIELLTPVSESRLVDVARKTWASLRFDVPTLASRVVVEGNALPRLVYRAEDAVEVDKWASRTFIVHKSDKFDLEAIREDLAGHPIPSSDGDQTWLHLALDPSGGSIKKFGLLLHTHHAPFDGTALKIIFNKYLKRCAESLNGQLDTDNIPWGEELDNLPLPMTEILGPEEPLPIPPSSSEEPSFALPYYATLGGVLQGIGENMVNPYTFKPRKLSSDKPAYQYQYVAIKKEDSAAIADILRSGLPGGPYTVTHLAHAALAMVIATDNPVTSEASSRTMFNLSLVNERSRLQEKYSTRDGYPGYALGVFPLILAMSAFLDEGGKPLPFDEALLLKLVTAMRDLYNKQKEFPCQIAYMAQSTNIFCEAIKHSIATGQSAPSNYRFASDGRGETYLDPVFQDASGKPVLSIERCFTTLNGSDLGPFFRVSSWGGEIELSVDYNSKTHSREEAQSFLNLWKGYTLQILKASSALQN